VKVGILGATGPAGRALAARLADSGHQVTLGSRSQDRAEAAAAGLRRRWPDHHLDVAGGTNADAAGAGLVVVATPWDAAGPTAATVAEQLVGKVVVSMANGIEEVSGELRAVHPAEGSVAEAVARAVPEALVTSAFHHLPARALAALAGPVAGDVLVCGDDAGAVEAAMELVGSIPRLRPLAGGSLAMSGPVEAFTAVLLGVNLRHRAHTTLALTGLEVGPEA